MSTTIVPQKTRHDLLQESEFKIAQASRDTVESIRIIGQELTKIEEEELYEVMGKNDFKEYVEVCLRWNYQVARAWMRASKALVLLDQQKLQLPFNQSQVLELTKLKNPEVQVGVWQKILDFCDREQKAVTYDIVKDAVTYQRTKANKFVTRSRGKKQPARGIEIDLETDNGDEPKTPSLWSEEGEKALNRIRRLCGDAVANALNSANPAIAERDLIKWAEQEADMVKSLAYYIVYKRWTLRKALAYEESAFDMETTVEELGDLARSRGGKAVAQIADVKITVEIVS